MRASRRKYCVRIPTYQLMGQQENSFEAELAIAEVKEVLQAWAKEIEDHRKVIVFRCEPPDERGDTHTHRRESCKPLTHTPAGGALL